jgi:hypothetical protein
MNDFSVRLEPSAVSLEGGAAGAPATAIVVGDTVDLLGDGAGLDALSRLYVLMGRASEQTAEGQRREIEQAAQQRHQALQKMISELRQAMKEREEASGWGSLGNVLSKIGTFAALGAAIGLAVVSCGAAAPITALAFTGAGLSLLGAAQSEFHVLEKAGMSKEAANWVGIGCTVGGGLCSAGAGALMAGSAAAESANAAGELRGEIVRWGNVAGGASSVAGGAAKGVSALYERGATQHDINAYKAQQFMESMQRLLTAIIDRIEESKESEQSKVSRIVQAIETQGACLAAAAASTGVAS